MEKGLADLNEAFGTSYCLNEDQIEVVEKIVEDSISCSHEKTDFVIQLPTGRGKTLILQLLPFIFNETAVLIITPTDAIVLDFVARFKQFGFQLTSQCLSDYVDGKQSPEVNRMKHRDFKYLVSQPEIAMSANGVKFLKEVCIVRFIGIDEAHCVLFWGASQFRPSFLELSKLHCILPDAQFIACTATLTPTSRQEVIKLLGLSNVHSTIRNPDRRNIFLEVLPRPPVSNDLTDAASSVEYVVKPLILALKNNPDEGKKVVYMTLRWCGYCHDLSKRLLGTATGPVCQYHAPQSKSMKKDIIDDIQQKTPNSSFQLIFATEAFSMGVHSPDIRHCIHVGLANSLEVYLQEFGRIGRDGEPAVATIYFNAADIAGNKKYLDSAMRDYVLLKTCRRAYIHEHFVGNSSDFQPVYPQCQCCDNCKVECDCDLCLNQLATLSLSTDQSTHVETSVENAEMCTSSLLAYFEQENEYYNYSSQPQLCSGLTTGLAEYLSRTYLCDNSELTAAIVQADNPFLNIGYCEKIVDIILMYRASCLV